MVTSPMSEYQRQLKGASKNIRELRFLIFLVLDLLRKYQSDLSWKYVLNDLQMLVYVV